MRISELVQDLRAVENQYGNLVVRVDLGSETEQRAFPVGYTMAATFTYENNKVCIVVFISDHEKTRSDIFTCARLAEQLTAWQVLLGDVDVRIDLGFLASGLCHDIDNVLIGEFTSENLKALVLYPATSRQRINVIGRGLSVN